MPRLSRARPALGLAILLGSFAALAQAVAAAPGAASTTQLAPVTAPLPEGSPARDSASDSPSRRDATGTLSVVKVPDTVEGTTQASDLLEQAPGIAVQDTGGFGQSKALVVRGASSTGTLVFLDGIPLNGAGDIADVSKIPAGELARVEVLRGGVGALYGSGGLGGVVNLVTRTPSPGQRGWAQLSYGSFGTELGQLGASTTWSKGSALLSLDGSHSDGSFPYQYDALPALPTNPLDLRHRVNNQDTQGDGLFKLAQELGEWKTQLLLQGGLLSRGLAGTVEQPSFQAHQDNDRVLLGLRAERVLGPGVDLTLRAYGRREHDIFTAIPFSPDEWQVQSTAGLAADASYLWGINGLSASLELAGEGLRVSTRENPQRFSVGALVQDELLLFGGTLGVAPAFRVDQVGQFTGISPKLGARLDLPRGFQLRANGGQAFRAPSFLELYVVQGTLLPNPDLKPERALYLDGAVSHETSWSRVSLGAFTSVYDNLIAYEYYPPFRSRPQNFATAQVTGGELEVSVTPRPWLSVRGSYTLQTSADLHDDERFYLKELPNLPRHKLFARVEGGLPFLHAHAEVLYQSAQFTNRSDSLTLPARTFVNAGIVADVLQRPALSVGVEVKNVLDDRAEDYDGYPLPGRGYYATVRVALERPAPSRSPSSPAPAS